MPYDDGRNSARARSARIRASHDYEATHLEEMRRRTREGAQPATRIALMARVASAFSVLHPKPATQVPVAQNEIEAAATRVE